jgi:hypothetical protein
MRVLPPKPARFLRFADGFEFGFVENGDSLPIAVVLNPAIEAKEMAAMIHSRNIVAALILALGFAGSVQYIEAARSAPVVAARFQAVAGAALSNSQNGVVSMLWLLGDDGKVRLCKGADGTALTVTCSAAVAPQ